ncbi:MULTISPECIES: fimbrial protein [Pseudomonas]|uniref:Type 1 fimbrial protein n=1 Tax=Pseudomonas protegens TaxID=380021 RepID=A0A2T6GNV3_9PSED|nr:MULTISPECIES: fimbrial protein [Pseudomonas]PUA45845.1 type 1 fimbrial protein [Pseudomonas protegens]ULT69325.1 type 1 fimbrial protein [Pseudomonas sp. BC42]BAQ79416.1 fimbrial subunit CupB6 [Pseudomonas sp. St29]
MMRQWLRLIATRKRLSLWIFSGMFSGLLGVDAQAAQVNAFAVNCEFSNGNGTPWVAVTPLDARAKEGDVLWQRAVSLYTNYRYVPSGSRARELVTVGNWSGGTPQRFQSAPTNVDGIGFRVAVRPDSGQPITLTQTPGLIALEKSELTYDTGNRPQGTMLTHFTQSLILTVPPDQLPSGKLTVDRVVGSSNLMLYAFDLPANQASLGSEVTWPTDTSPPGICQHNYPLMGPELISMGGGGPIEIPNTCVVEGYKTIPVPLGRFALTDFPKVNDTSAAVPFSIELSRCAANAKPHISFTDKSAGSSIPGVLGLSGSGPSGRPAKGFGIVVINDLTRLPIEYNGTRYEMQRVGDGARIPLRAGYIRTGNDGEIDAGQANGAAEFTFTFP